MTDLLALEDSEKYMALMLQQLREDHRVSETLILDEMAKLEPDSKHLKLHKAVLAHLQATGQTISALVVSLHHLNKKVSEIALKSVIAETELSGLAQAEIGFRINLAMRPDLKSKAFKKYASFLIQSVCSPITEVNQK